MKKNVKKYLIVDGYNIINAWDELKQIAQTDLEHSREKLIDYIIEYAEYTGRKGIIVFDAYNMKNSKGKKEERKHITIVYTKEFQTADSYIEAFMSTLSKYDDIRVATNDYAEQLIVLGKGATRVTSRELKLELDIVKTRIRQESKSNKIQRNALEDRLDTKTLSKLENIRRNR